MSLEASRRQARRSEVRQEVHGIRTAQHHEERDRVFREFVHRNLVMLGSIAVLRQVIPLRTTASSKHRKQQRGDDRLVKIKSLKAARSMKIKWLVFSCIEADHRCLQVNTR